MVGRLKAFTLACFLYERLLSLLILSFGKLYFRSNRKPSYDLRIERAWHWFPKPAFHRAQDPSGPKGPPEVTAPIYRPLGKTAPTQACWTEDMFLPDRFQRWNGSPLDHVKGLPRPVLRGTPLQQWPECLEGQVTKTDPRAPASPAHAPGRQMQMTTQKQFVRPVSNV